jgi:hypothetical protein
MFLRLKDKNIFVFASGLEKSTHRVGACVAYN